MFANNYPVGSCNYHDKRGFLKCNVFPVFCFNWPFELFFLTLQVKENEGKKLYEDTETKSFKTWL